MHLRAQRNESGHRGDARKSGLAQFGLEEAAVIHGVGPPELVMPHTLQRVCQIGKIAEFSQS